MDLYTIYINDNNEIVKILLDGQDVLEDLEDLTPEQAKKEISKLDNLASVDIEKW